MALSKQEAEAIAKAGMEGDFTAAEFGVTTASAIKGSYVAKQALKGGATSAIIEAALVLGPEIYEIIKNYIDTGELNLEQLKAVGSDGLSAAGDGYLKGSISTALIVLCQAGKLGAEFKNCSPEVIGTLTVLIRAIHECMIKGTVKSHMKREIQNGSLFCFPPQVKSRSIRMLENTCHHCLSFFISNDYNVIYYNK